MASAVVTSRVAQAASPPTTLMVVSMSAAVMPMLNLVARTRQQCQSENRPEPGHERAAEVLAEACEESQRREAGELERSCQHDGRLNPDYNGLGERMSGAGATHASRGSFL